MAPPFILPLAGYFHYFVSLIIFFLITGLIPLKGNLHADGYTTSHEFTGGNTTVTPFGTTHSDIYSLADFCSQDYAVNSDETESIAAMLRNIPDKLSIYRNVTEDSSLSLSEEDAQVLLGELVQGTQARTKGEDWRSFVERFSLFSPLDNPEEITVVYNFRSLEWGFQEGGLKGTANCYLQTSATGIGVGGSAVFQVSDYLGYAIRGDASMDHTGANTHLQSGPQFAFGKYLIDVLDSSEETKGIFNKESVA